MAEHKVFSACPHDCPDTCAMITTVRDGQAIDVRGNPDHPFTRGGLCVKVNDYQNRVYSTDRVLYPLKRTGRKGTGEFPLRSNSRPLSPPPKIPFLAGSSGPRESRVYRPGNPA